MALSPAEWLVVGLTGILIVLVSIIGWQTWRGSRITPEEAERRRRMRLSETGKMGDATLLEIHESYVIYTYDVRGVAYTASQDVTAFKEQIPPEAGSPETPIVVRYDARNPADSIVLAEDWNGLTMLRKSG